MFNQLFNIPLTLHGYALSTSLSLNLDISIQREPTFFSLYAHYSKRDSNNAILSQHIRYFYLIAEQYASWWRKEQRGLLNTSRTIVKQTGSRKHLLLPLFCCESV